MNEGFDLHRTVRCNYWSMPELQTAVYVTVVEERAWCINKSRILFSGRFKIQRRICKESLFLRDLLEIPGDLTGMRRVWLIIHALISSFVREMAFCSWFDIKTLSYQYMDSRCEDKTILRSFDLHNVISCAGKTTSLHWIRTLIVMMAYTLLQITLV